MSGRPHIVLIGGTTGTGKSTVAVELARRLGINRVASTDVVRETMRAFFGPDVLPSIHHSSFESKPLIQGFVEQSQRVAVGVAASIDRALEEGWSLVMEGVHLVPGLLDVGHDAVLTECVLRISDETLHAQHFFARAERGQRAAAKYLDHLREIRALQDYIVDRAEDEGIAVIENERAEVTVDALEELVLARARA